MKKTALITGATSGIGKAIAEYYTFKNYNIISVSRMAQDYSYNLSDQTDLAEFIIRLNKADISKIDVLVNNAGAFFIEEGVHNVNYLYNLLLYTPYVLMSRLATKLIGGHIINIASVSGMLSDQDFPMYSALKAGVITLTKSFAKRLAPGIRVNCISPGFFNTNLVAAATPTHLFKSLPVPREGDPKEITTVVKMLDETPYITGANIVIDGGLTT